MCSAPPSQESQHPRRPRSLVSCHHFLPGAFPGARGRPAKNWRQGPPRLVSDPSSGRSRAGTVQGKCLFRNAQPEVSAVLETVLALGLLCHPHAVRRPLPTIFRGFSSQKSAWYALVSPASCCILLLECQFPFGFGTFWAPPSHPSFWQRSLLSSHRFETVGKFARSSGSPW